MNPAYWLPFLLGLAVLLPLASFFAILIFGPRMGKVGESAAYCATGAIGFAAFLSFVSLFLIWLPEHPPGQEDAATHAAASGSDGETVVRGQDGHSETQHADEEHDAGHDGHGGVPVAYAGEYTVLGSGSPWVLGQFGDLRLSISYYIDSLTVCMFCMVTFIATLIHVYAMGYMHEELHDVTDPEVTTGDGEPFRRPGRYHRFFQYLSLFCFSMLGLVVAGNIAMVFVFWELVGICSYFLIGFYVERKTASNAANKAFIVNRVGDFGMIIGLMALWTSLGTFSFGDIGYTDRDGNYVRPQPGIFSLVRTAENHHELETPRGMVLLAARDEVAQLDQAPSDEQIDAWRHGTGDGKRQGYWLLVIAGVGIFTGCVGKSAQFPLHTWLPDAMEGPTPVSALVHSATMVAAGVYLVARFYPVFAPEALLVIAVVGCITLFLAATIAITATDIKRVLAYSTISQLGYMMMALGVGAWVAGVLHLITHAFFKSLLFMCSGSVIHAVHTNEMTEMGGLRKKMPVTAYTMLVGCLAIAGAGIPFMMGLFGQGLAGLGLSGFYSKDAILEQAFSFMQRNNSPFAGAFFLAAAGGAAITAFYMFRLWYLTFAGEPRDVQRFEHAHESPPAMYLPLVILSVMAVTVAWNPVQGIVGGLIALIGFAIFRSRRLAASFNDSSVSQGHGHAAEDHGDHGDHDQLPANLVNWPLGLSGLVLAIAAVWYVGPYGVALVDLLEDSRPAGTLATSHGVMLSNWVWPNEHDAHAANVVVPVSLIAIGTAFSGFLFATLMYGLGKLNPADVRGQFEPVYQFLLNKWWFDELYDWLFVKPTHVLSRMVAGFDRNWIDWMIDEIAAMTRRFSVFWDWLADRSIVDGLVNLIASWTYAIGVSLRAVQTGRLRQYIMFIVIGAVALFIVISFFWNPTLAR